MKAGAKRKTLTPPPNSTDDQITDQLQLGKRSRRGQNNGDEDRPKLAEGFYEIEALRKIRIRKGVKQYLIKWRGYPESANSWEPVESFLTCPDVLEAFESMNSGKGKRKRKRGTGSISHLKKKQTQHQDSPDPCVENSNMTENNVGCTNDNGTAKESNECDGKLSEMNQENMTEFAIHIQEDPVEPANRVSKVDGTEETQVLRSSPRFGARRRKSCAVKRFKKESNTGPRKDATKKPTAVSDVIVQDDIKNEAHMVNGLDTENVLETRESVPVITKIVQPVNYTISIVNDTEDVCVSFLVTRSDGEEIVVDNKYLKENNPVLLINYYEQHLRYNSPSE